MPKTQTFCETKTSAQDFIDGLSKIDWLKPNPYVNVDMVKYLALKHLDALSLPRDGNSFSSKVGVRIVWTGKEYDESNGWPVYAPVTSDTALYCLARFKAHPQTWPEPSTPFGKAVSEAMGVAHKAVRAVMLQHKDMKSNVASCAIYVVSDALMDILSNTQNSVWTPLMDIFAMGCVPSECVFNGELAVWIPSDSP